MDTVVYETKGKPTYVIQYETENHEWVDTYPSYRSKEAAVRDLDDKAATPYPYRIVKREG